ICVFFLLLIWTGINSRKNAVPVIPATIGTNVPLNLSIRQLLGKKDGVIIVGISAEDVKYYTPYKTSDLKIPACLF
ncbi:MAG TPA: hypothetical protein VK796_04655, partial [Cytophaga sp.]|nr:hypothetical protein [Cytophaga sp.]